MQENKLLQLLKKKKGLFESFLDLTETESLLSVSEWESVLKQKKVLLSCIEDIDERLQSFKEGFTEISQEVTNEIDDIKQIVSRILELDSLNYLERKRELRSYEQRIAQSQ
ncbi:MAG: hypothetical protein RSB82_01520 [Victivallaceae bacterium]